MTTTSTFSGQMTATQPDITGYTIGEKGMALTICGIDFIEVTKTVESLHEYIQELEAKIKLLHNHLFYMPDGPGYFEARSSFENNRES